jgi:hypothetical protein
MTISYRQWSFVGGGGIAENVKLTNVGKISENRCIEDGEKINFTLHISPLHQECTAQHQERLHQPMISPMTMGVQ